MELKEFSVLVLEFLWIWRNNIMFACLWEWTDPERKIEVAGKSNRNVEAVAEHVSEEAECQVRVQTR